METGIACEERDFFFFYIQSTADFWVKNKWVHIVVFDNQKYKSKIREWIKQYDYSTTRECYKAA